MCRPSVESDDQFSRRKERDFDRWRRNEEEDPRERDDRQGHREISPRGDPRLARDKSDTLPMTVRMTKAARDRLAVVQRWRACQPEQFRSECLRWRTRRSGHYMPRLTPPASRRLAAEANE